jgi:hypothetical protein
LICFYLFYLFIFLFIFAARLTFYSFIQSLLLVNRSIGSPWTRVSLPPSTAAAAVPNKTFGFCPKHHKSSGSAQSIITSLSGSAQSITSLTDSALSIINLQAQPVATQVVRLRLTHGKSFGSALSNKSIQALPRARKSVQCSRLEPFRF